MAKSSDGTKFAQVYVGGYVDDNSQLFSKNYRSSSELMTSLVFFSYCYRIAICAYKQLLEMRVARDRMIEFSHFAGCQEVILVNTHCSQATWSNMRFPQLTFNIQLFSYYSALPGVCTNKHTLHKRHVSEKCLLFSHCVFVYQMKLLIYFSFPFAANKIVFSAKHAWYKRVPKSIANIQL